MCYVISPTSVMPGLHLLVSIGSSGSPMMRRSMQEAACHRISEVFVCVSLFVCMDSRSTTLVNGGLERHVNVAQQHVKWKQLPGCSYLYKTY